MKKITAITFALLMVFCCSPLCLAEQEIPVIDDISDVIDNYSGGYDSTLNLFYDYDTQTLTASDDDYIIGFKERIWDMNYITGETVYDAICIDRSVKTVILKEGITNISNCFNDMQALETVVLPQSLKTLNESFNGCPNLKNVTFAGSDMRLDKNTFTDCPALQSLTVSTEKHPVKWIGENLVPKPTVFYDFNEKTGTLTVSGEGKASGHLWRSEGGGFEDVGMINKVNEDHTIKHLIIKEGITEIYNGFNDLMALETVQLPHSIKKIGDSFQGCEKLKEISFPRSVESIWGYCFNDCLSLEKITFRGPVDIGSHYQQGSFNNLPKLKRLYLPDGSSVSGYSFCRCKRLGDVIIGGPAVEIASFAYEEHGAAFGGCPRIRMYGYEKHNRSFANQFYVFGLDNDRRITFTDLYLGRAFFLLIVLAVLALFGAAIYVRIRKVRQDRIKRKTERNPEW